MTPKTYTITFLGTGTSTGVPVIGCHCRTCSSLDPRDRRLRASVLITLPSGKNLLIDCGPDFRTQILKLDSPKLEGALLTHSHYDHVGGIDDLRPYCAGVRDFPLYCKSDVAQDLRERNPWSFAEKLYPGVPTFDIHEIEPNKPFEIADTEILPIHLMHGKLAILGYRIGPLAYITDCSELPEASIEALRGVDTLVINALRLRSHPSHFSLDQALRTIAQINPRQAFLTHISHDMPPHVHVNLPQNISLSYDGQVIEVS